MLRDFVDLTLANEVEIAVLGKGDERTPTWLISLFERIQARASEPVRLGAAALMGTT
jgi:hypothetical protein